MASSTKDQQTNKQNTTRSSANNARSAKQAQVSAPSTSSSTTVPTMPQAQPTNQNPSTMQLSLANAMQMMGGGGLQEMQMQLQHMPMSMQAMQGMPIQTMPGMQMTTTTSSAGVGSGISKAARQVVPAFLQKLYEMVNDPNNAELIRWSDAGDSFFVLDHERFAREVLGRWFKHQRFSSFVRQLNMYGFHKIPHLQQGVLKSDSQETEFWNFAHANFHRGQPDLLCLIQRKKQVGGANVGVVASGGGGEDGGGVIDFRVGGGDGNVGLIGPGPSNAASSSTSGPTQNSFASSSNSSSAPSTTQPPALTSTQLLDIHSIVSGITAIKRHQTTISAELNQLKQSNQMLWQDALAARARHQKQQDTINRIVKFLAGVFGHGAGGAAGGAGTGPGAMASAMGAFGQGGGSQSSGNGSQGTGSPGGGVSDKGAPHMFGGRRRMRLMIEDTNRDSTGMEKEKEKMKTGRSGVINELGPEGMDVDDILDMDTDARLEELEDELTISDDHREEESEESGQEGEGEGMHNSSYDYPTVETPGSIPSPAASDGASLAVVDASPSPSPAGIGSSASYKPTTTIASPQKSNTDSSMSSTKQTQDEQGKQLSRSATPSSRFPHPGSRSRTPTNATPGNSAGSAGSGANTMFELDPRISGVFNQLTPSQIQQLLASLASQGMGSGLDTSSNLNDTTNQGSLNSQGANVTNGSGTNNNPNFNAHETTSIGSGPLAAYVPPTSYDFSLNPAAFTSLSGSGSYTPYGYTENTMNTMNFNTDELIPFEGYDPSITDPSSLPHDDGGLGMGFDFGGGDLNGLSALSASGAGSKTLQQQQHEERMQGQWLAAEDIDKDVNALNSSINSLIQTFGLDVGLLDDDAAAGGGSSTSTSGAGTIPPGNVSSLSVAGKPGDKTGSSPTDGEGKDFDFDMFFNNLSSMPMSTNGMNPPMSNMGTLDGMNADTSNVDSSVNTNDTGMNEYMTSAFLDEAHTPSSLASDHITPNEGSDLDIRLDGVDSIDAAIGGMKASAARGNASMPGAGAGSSTTKASSATDMSSRDASTSLTAMTTTTAGKKRKSGVDLEDLFASKMDVVDDSTPVLPPASSAGPGTGRTTRTRSGTANGGVTGSIAVSRPKRRKDK